jgi:tetratricopeptide (TPR) repeat protein
MSSKDADKGIADLRIILNEDPGHVKAHRLKARAHMEKGETALARESLENAIQAQPQEIAANFELAKLLVQSGEADEAVEVLEKLLKFAPDHLGVLQSMAQIRIRQQKWDEVAPLAQTIQKKYSANPLGYYYQGLVEHGREQYEKSIQSFEQSLERAPDGVEPLIALARSQVALDQIGKALERVEQVVNRNPEHFLALNLKGEIQLRQEKLDAAKATFDQVIELKPEWPIPYRNLSKISAIREDHDGYLAALQLGYEKSKDPGLGLEVASIYEREGETDKAIFLYEEVLVSRPDMAVAANNLAMILMRDNPQQDALDRAMDLVKGFSVTDNPIYLDTLGWVHYKRGELQDAVTILEKASRKADKVSEIHYHLGMAYYKSGEMEKAKKALTKAVAQEDEKYIGRDEAEQTLAGIGSSPATAQ